MSRFLVRVGNRYCLWSSVVDAPVTNFLTRQKMEEELAERYEPDQATKLFARALPENDPAVLHNRAGPNESRATVDELLELYKDDGS